MQNRKTLMLLVVIMLVGCADADRETPEVVVEKESAPSLPGGDIGTATDYPECGAVNGITPICGFKNPEDLAVVPGGDLLLVSEMGAFMSNSPGTLSFLDIANQQRLSIKIDWENDGDRWGDNLCAAPEPTRFSPHGIDLMTRSDGRHQLLVVNHGSEAIEFFELIKPGSSWQLHWKGCAKPVDDLFMNDVASLNDGGFFVTHMWNKSTPFPEVVAKLTAGENVGWIMEWQQEAGFVKVPGSDAMMPNGIAVNKDNSKIFVNIYMASKTIRIDRATSKIEAEMIVKNPDNIVIDSDGNLWVASHLNDPIEGRCEDNHAGPCLLPFQIIKADPESMQPQVAFTHDGAPMGYVTVGLPHRARLYMGSASGDRLASIALTPAP